MTENLTINNSCYEVTYDDEWITALLTALGIEPKRSLDLTKRAVLYYSLDRKIKQVYARVGEENGVNGSTVATHVRRGLENATYNGMLKNIDDYFENDFYDYDNGFSNKEFIATANDYMITTGHLKIKLLQKGEK